MSAKIKTDFWLVNDSVGSDFGIYINEPEPLKLEVGKFYKTRGGERAVVLGIEKNNKDGFPVYVAVLDDFSETFYVKTDGRYNSDNTDEEVDLVAPWEEAK